MQPATKLEPEDEGRRPGVAPAGDPERVGRVANGLRIAVGNPESAGKVEAAPASSDRAVRYLAKRQAIVLEVIAGFSESRSLSAALFATSNELHHRFKCDRVALGLVDEEQIDVVAVSQQAAIDRRSDEIRLLREAMAEACEQEAIVQYPQAPGDPLRLEAHRALLLGDDRIRMCTIPLCHEERIIGALLLQHRSERPWSKMTIELLGQVAIMIAPLIDLRRTAEFSLSETLQAHANRALGRLVAPKHLAAKCSAGIVILGFACAHWVPVTQRIVAAAELVPEERRVISAPNKGFIESVFVNAGDHVLAGDPLLRLDTRDLELQKSAQENEVSGANAEVRAAMASYDRTAMTIARARLDQLTAQLALTQQQITRSDLTAPADGVVVSGDLTQSLGMVVERGSSLLEMAPADGYEVHLLVDETDVSYVKIGQTGRLSLESDPRNRLPVEVRAIHPIARAGGGSNRFLVEAIIDDEHAGLRPGQTGIARIDVGEASLLWVWTHRFVEWSRQRLWEWIG